MKTYLKFSLIVLICFLSLNIVYSQKVNPLGFQVEYLDMEIQEFDRQIVIGFGQRAVRYKEALVLKIKVTFNDYLKVKYLNNAPLLFIDSYAYNIFKDEPGAEEHIRILTFHIPNWKDIDKDASIAYTFNHQNPHGERNRDRIRDSSKMYKQLYQIKTRQ